MCYYQMDSKMNVHKVTSISNSKAKISTTAPLSKAISQDAATGCITASEPTLQRKWNRNSKLNFLSSLPVSCSRKCNGTPTHDEMIETGGHIEESIAHLFACFLSMIMAIATNKLMPVTLSQDWRPLILKQPQAAKGKLKNYIVISGS